MLGEGNTVEVGLPLPLLDGGVCLGCCRCIEVCASGALGIMESRVAVVRPEQCNYCGECEEACPRGGISLAYEVIFLEDVEGT